MIMQGGCIGFLRYQPKCQLAIQLVHECLEELGYMMFPEVKIEVNQQTKKDATQMVL
jgi:hypothetical protein